ncbi:MAG: serine protein kinase RIO [DPANN group archaeon]|nr:serine protein kinase RIO [DPANN group archaeon]
MAKRSLEKWKTYKNVFDNFTIHNLDLLSGKGYFDELLSPIAIGKEANIFTAKAGRKRIILKIYRLENCDFNRMYSYIRADSRYPTLKKNRRGVIFAWAQREYRNLYLARKIGIRVPTPIHRKDNIIIMEMIGKGEPAPQLKNDYPADPERFYREVVTFMARMHRKGLVHGDLSGFNILNNRERPVFIDFSQSTTRDSPDYDELLHRDARNIARFFQKAGVETSTGKLLRELEKEEP